MNADWRPFAEKLTDLAKEEGKDNFLSKMFEFLNDYITVDSCAVFKIAADKITGAEHLCTFGNLESDLANLLAEDYITNGFRNDPMVKTALSTPIVKVRQIPWSQYPYNYRSQYFEKAGLVDKVTSIHVTDNRMFLISFYRHEEHGVFNPPDFKDLQRLAPIIGRFVLSHMHLTQKTLRLSNVVEQRVTELLEDNTQVFSQLSRKERLVCKHILLGKQEKEVAKLLGISSNTVVTHRRRFYSKLNIRSKAELFQLALGGQSYHP